MNLAIGMPTTLSQTLLWGDRSLNFGADFGFDSKMTKSGKHVELLEMSLVKLKSSVRNDNTSYALAAVPESTKSIRSPASHYNEMAERAVQWRRTDRSFVVTTGIR